MRRFLLRRVSRVGLAVWLALVCGLEGVPAWGAGAGAEGGAREISLVTWNPEWFPGGRLEADEGSAAAHMALGRHELRRMNPDVFLAQEIRDWDSFARLCEAVPGLSPAAVSAFTHEETGEYWPQQVAVGSKLRVVAAWSEPWRQGAELRPRRGFAAAALDIGRGRLLLVYSVHLKSNRGNDDEAEKLRNFQTREESVRQLLEHARHMEEVVFPGRVAGVVVGGDFNTNGDGDFGDRTVEILKGGGFHHAWSRTPKERRLTWRGNARFAPTTLDHFFTKGLGTPEAELVETAQAASDHLAVRLRVRLPE